MSSDSRRQEWHRCVDFLRKRDVGVLSTVGEVFVKATKKLKFISAFLSSNHISLVKNRLPPFFCGVKQCAWGGPLSIVETTERSSPDRAYSILHFVFQVIRKDYAYAAPRFKVRRRIDGGAGDFFCAQRVEYFESLAPLSENSQVIHVLFSFA